MSIVKSLEQLFVLGALTDDYKLSEPVGRQMAQLPLDPIYSKALILASEFNCLEEMLITVAMLSVESIFYAPREKLDEVCISTPNFCYWFLYMLTYLYVVIMNMLLYVLMHSYVTLCLGIFAVEIIISCFYLLHYS